MALNALNVFLTIPSASPTLEKASAFQADRVVSAPMAIDVSCRERKPAVKSPEHAPERGRRAARAFASLGALVLWTGLAGCGPSTPDAATPPAPKDTSAPAEQPTSAPSTSASPSAGSSADPAPKEAAAAKPGVPFDSVPSPGTSPLNTDESKELKTGCKKFVDAVTAAAKKAGAGKRPIDGLFEALAHPPAVAGTDTARCADLMRRETIDYFAQSREGEAKINLRRIIVGLISALEQSPSKLCATAGAIPPAIETIKTQPYSSKPEDWAAEGWKCARFDLSGAPQVFQYELRTDAKAKTYEVIARGYPVMGGPMTELFISGKVENGVIDPSTPILRR